MSDTSDFTEVGDSDLNTLQPDVTPAAIPPMVSLINETQDVLKTIRESVGAAYNLSLPPATEPPSPEKNGKKVAYRVVKDFVDVLGCFDTILSYTDGKGLRETAGPLADSMVAMAQAMDATRINNPTFSKAEGDALTQAVVRQLQSQAVQRARASLFPDLATDLAYDEVYDALLEIVDTVAYTYRASSKSVSDILDSLLPKYARSCAASGDSASWVSAEYIKYAKHVLSGLDSGEDKA